MRTSLAILFAVLCILIGAYPLIYIVLEGKTGLLNTKSDLVLSSTLWRAGFYTHIVCGGIALIVGWPQFIKSWRNKYIRLHRSLGMLYVVMVCMGGLSAICIAPFSTAGWIAASGFGSLGVLWLYFTVQAFRSIRQRNIREHENNMIYSYSATLSAVTLRLWLPLLIFVFRLDFNVAYPIVAWLAWVPNLFVARAIVSKAG